MLCFKCANTATVRFVDGVPSCSQHVDAQCMTQGDGTCVGDACMHIRGFELLVERDKGEGRIM